MEVRHIISNMEMNLNKLRNILPKKQHGDILDSFELYLRYLNDESLNPIKERMIVPQEEIKDRMEDSIKDPSGLGEEIYEDPEDQVVEFDNPYIDAEFDILAKESLRKLQGDKKISWDEQFEMVKRKISLTLFTALDWEKRENQMLRDTFHSFFRTEKFRSLAPDFDLKSYVLVDDKMKNAASCLSEIAFARNQQLEIEIRRMPKFAKNYEEKIEKKTRERKFYLDLYESIKEFKQKTTELSIKCQKYQENALQSFQRDISKVIGLNERLKIQESHLQARNYNLQLEYKSLLEKLKSYEHRIAQLATNNSYYRHQLEDFRKKRPKSSISERQKGKLGRSTPLRSPGLRPLRSKSLVLSHKQAKYITPKRSESVQEEERKIFSSTRKRSSSLMDCPQFRDYSDL